MRFKCRNFFFFSELAQSHLRHAVGGFAIGAGPFCLRWSKILNVNVKLPPAQIRFIRKFGSSMVQVLYKFDQSFVQVWFKFGTSLVEVL